MVELAFTSLGATQPPDPILSFFLWLSLTIVTLGTLFAYRHVKTEERLISFTVLLPFLMAGHGFYLHYLISRILDPDVFLHANGLLYADVDFSTFDHLALLDEILFGVLGCLSLMVLLIAGWIRIRRGQPIHPEKKPKAILKKPAGPTLDVCCEILRTVSAHTDEILGC
jgi:ABC-type enterochelin transport system permease subunit